MKTAPQRLAWALQQCVEKKMRLTAARKRILRFLSEARQPVNLDQMNRAPGIKGTCDQATLWRTMMSLEELGLVRRVSLKSKMAHYALAMPDEHHDYLVCQDCGTVSDLPHTKKLDALQEEISKARGFTFEKHEVEIYGTCPDCQPARR
jgi:Fe2+ or Zn2+ uptake regulation protein